MDLREIDWGVLIGFDWLRLGPAEGCCECDDEPSGSCATELAINAIGLPGLAGGNVGCGLSRRRVLVNIVCSCHSLIPLRQNHFSVLQCSTLPTLPRCCLILQNSAFKPHVM
jgi:hypothetical protein